MKHLLTFAFILMCLVSCQKNGIEPSTDNTYLATIKAALKDSITQIQFTSLDFGKAVQSRINSDTSYLRIPVKGKSLEQEFILLMTNDKGNIQKGRSIVLSPKIISAGHPTRYDGGITIHNLQGHQLVQSPIVNGFITAFHQQSRSTQRTTTVPSPYVDLPEVVVISYRSLGGDFSFRDFMSLQNMFSGSSGGYNFYFSSVDGYPDEPGGGGGSGSGSTGGGPAQDPPILIDFESQQGNPAINLQKYLACFNSIPDAGAECTIEIFTDIPVDGDPNKLFNFDSESPGHAFLQIKKSNGGQSVLQNIGFYPESNWKTILTPAPVTGKFVDNSNHEFNASIKMTITPAQLREGLIHMQYLASFIRYDIDDYNCTDFALEVFNFVRHSSKRLEIPKYDIPGGMAPAGTSTPQGLYAKIKSMQQAGGAEASNISIPGSKGWVAGSKGPCN